MIKIEVNTTEIEVDFKKLSEELNLSITTVLRKVALDSFVQIVQRTPVDTGRARASWNIGINTIDLSVQPDTFEGGAAVADGIARSKESEIDDVKKTTDVINISNNLPYIIPLNEGHSQQAPSKFIETAVAFAAAQANAAAEA